MFKRLSSLFFGEVENVSTEITGPKPCVTEADEEGWLLVNLPGECLGGSGEVLRRPFPHVCLPIAWDCLGVEVDRPSWTEGSNLPSCNHRRTKTGSSKATSLPSLACPNPLVDQAVLPGSIPFSRGSTPVSPGSQSDCSCGPERCCMDESWFVTPPPCFTAEGATAETSPMEDLLIEHPSMSVYVSLGNQPAVEESGPSLAGSVRATETAPSAVRSAMPSRVIRGAASKAGALAKVTQVTRIQRAKAGADRRHLSRNRLQRQNRTREQVPRHAARIRGTFLHQPSQRSFCH
ncbi:tumor protein p53-inducible nuclear protein 2-like [Scleropages formosus]|uniref:Tumor protein p53-inducible nuclear protein 2-like n=1 Tax=Scleropages formosus TaxID=113540 RepID=A0A0P7TSL2_SCLFO|nr:tumor protein p53-inducible nuclear protein 2-like [Scleropages formosus]